jgi:2-dehydro-3-deoxyphosphogluconate aldolase/(4S)-4-hydroxy-2-oxoglutarate aldolase
VIAIEAVEQALPLADALLAGGIPLIEVTFRTPSAAEVIRTVTRTRPRMLVGAGTVLTQENLKAAVEAGARFAVAPGLNLKIVELARNLNVPFIPGVATASEIELALGAGSRILKFFPAELLGGVNMLNAMFSPYGHTGVRFIPTGGVSPANLEAYLRCPAVAAVGGTWLAKQSDLAGNKWDEIRKRCVAAVETVQRVRAEKSE